MSALARLQEAQENIIKHLIDREAWEATDEGSMGDPRLQTAGTLNREAKEILDSERLAGERPQAR